VKLFVALPPELGVESDVVESGPCEELDLDVITDQERRFDLESYLPIGPLHDVATRFVGNAAVRSVHHKRQKTIVY
jgi:hypothetical protein